jgi:hypothetical protein
MCHKMIVFHDSPTVLKTTVKNVMFLGCSEHYRFVMKRKRIWGKLSTVNLDVHNRQIYETAPLSHMLSFRLSLIWWSRRIYGTVAAVFIYNAHYLLYLGMASGFVRLSFVEGYSWKRVLLKGLYCTVCEFGNSCGTQKYISRTKTMPVSILELVGLGSATRTCAVSTRLFCSLSHKKGRSATPPPPPLQHRWTIHSLNCLPARLMINSENPRKHSRLLNIRMQHQSKKDRVNKASLMFM